MPNLFFVDNFYAYYLKLAEDKVPQVRIEFAKSMLDVKPYLEGEQDREFEIMETIEKLKEDDDSDVADATENTDAFLMT